MNQRILIAGALAATLAAALGAMALWKSGITSAETDAPAALPPPEKVAPAPVPAPAPKTARAPRLVRPTTAAQPKPIAPKASPSANEALWVDVDTHSAATLALTFSDRTSAEWKDDRDALYGRLMTLNELPCEERLQNIDSVIHLMLATGFSVENSNEADATFFEEVGGMPVNYLWFGTASALHDAGLGLDDQYGPDVRGAIDFYGTLIDDGDVEVRGICELFLERGLPGSTKGASSK
jgi:hypothetical protein